MIERRLTLLRHAKSSWKDPALADLDRPLTKRGRRDADAMASRMVAHGATFSVVLASPARRARETIGRMLVSLPAQDAQLSFDQRFYTFERDTLVDALRQTDDGLDDIMIVGHNPALHEILQWLTNETIADFPTCAAAQVVLTLPRWSKLKQGCGELMWVLAPTKENQTI